jgi:hypothetical protein
MPRDNFTIIQLDCTIDVSAVHYLKEYAAKHKGEFSKIYPWETDCASGDKILVALDTQSIGKPIVLGWMRVEMQLDSSDPHAHVYEISTLTDRTIYKGIGTALLIYLEKNFPIAFIELLSLPSALSFYEKIGFRKFTDTLPFVYKTVRRDPSAAYLSKQTKQRNDLKQDETEYINTVLQEVKSELPESLHKKFKEFLKQDDMNRMIIYETYVNGTMSDIIEFINKY